MAKNVWVEFAVVRKSQTGVKYLIEDTETGVVKRRDLLLGAGADVQAYGEANADDLFAAGDVVADGAVLVERLREQDVKDLHDEALVVIRQMIRNGDTLADIISAVQGVYSENQRVLDFMTDVYQVYNAGTAAQQRQFNVIMLYILTARG